MTFIIGLIAIFLFFYYPNRMKARSVSALVDKSMTMGQFIALNLSQPLYRQDKSTVMEIIEIASSMKICIIWSYRMIPVVFLPNIICREQMT
jgi:hypothetical protein